MLTEETAPNEDRDLKQNTLPNLGILTQSL